VQRQNLGSRNPRSLLGLAEHTGALEEKASPEEKMKKRNVGRLLSGLAAAVMAAGFASAVQAQELKTFNFMSSNDSSCSPFPQMNAEVFGFWEEEGIKVNFLSSETTVPYVAFLQNGDADLAMLDPPQVLQAVDNELPVKVVYEAYQFAPEGIVVTEDSPIKSLADLKDATIGLASDRDLITTVIAIESIGSTLEEMNIKTVVVGDSGPVMAGALKNKTIQAFAGGSSDRAGIEAAGVRIRNITPAEVSRNPGNNLVVWGPTLEEKRPLITAFLRGWAKAQLAGPIDTKLTAAACRTKIPEQFENLQTGLNMINANVYTMQLRRTKYFGELQPDIWKAIQPPYVKLKEISRELDPATFLDPSFIEAVNDFTTDEVKTKINAWKEANQDKLIN
jgi:NitT/TauT family transport system substrate-binding protein